MWHGLGHKSTETTRVAPSLDLTPTQPTLGYVLDGTRYLIQIPSILYVCDYKARSYVVAQQHKVFLCMEQLLLGDGHSEADRGGSREHAPRHMLCVRCKRALT